MKQPTWDQFSRAWKFILGTGCVVYGVLVTAESSPGALPYVLVSGMGLLGLSISVPWERGKKDE